jgi:hypothetical protein
MTSVGLDLAEAVRAVDGPIHSRLERDLGLVAARGADHGEVLARDPIVSSLIASGSADFSNVISGIAAGPPAGSTARTAFGVGREPLLHVVLLVGRRMNEFHSAVHAGERPIGVGHVTLPLPCFAPPVRHGQVDRRTGLREERRKSRRRVSRCRCGVPVRGAPVCSSAEDTTGRKIRPCGYRGSRRRQATIGGRAN